MTPDSSELVDETKVSVAAGNDGRLVLFVPHSAALPALQVKYFSHATIFTNY